jgi:hypothetical protein
MVASESVFQLVSLVLDVVAIPLLGRHNEKFCFGSLN